MNAVAAGPPPDGRWDAVVVGAGPAGCAAAAALAARGRRVLLLEKDRLPRRKVCGEFLSARARPALERLGVLDEVRGIARPISRGTLHLPSGRALSFPLAGPALGISRFAFDALLARRAAALGAEVRCGARVTALEREGGGFRVRWTGAPGAPGGEAHATAAVGAWGRWDALDRALERRFGRERSRYSGWSRDYRPGGLAPGDEVSLFVFRGGYCGLSPVEGGRAHLAGIVSERLRRDLGGRWESVEAHARRSNPALERGLRDAAPDDDALGTGPVYFTRKPPASGAAVLAGDAAGVLDPFSGEGQASALLAGLLAGDAVGRALDGETPLERLASTYAAAWRHALGRRFAWSSAFRRLMLSPRLATAAADLAGGWLLNLAVRKLAEPGDARRETEASEYISNR